MSPEKSDLAEGKGRNGDGDEVEEEEDGEDEEVIEEKIIADVTVFFKLENFFFYFFFLSLSGFPAGPQVHIGDQGDVKNAKVTSPTS